jgi:hypothetical protein
VKLTTHLHLELRSKNERSYTSTPTIRLHGVVLSLKKDRDNFTFTFIEEYLERLRKTTRSLRIADIRAEF